MTEGYNPWKWQWNSSYVACCIIIDRQLAVWALWSNKILEIERKFWSTGLRLLIKRNGSQSWVLLKYQNIWKMKQRGRKLYSRWSFSCTQLLKYRVHECSWPSSKQMCCVARLNLLHTSTLLIYFSNLCEYPLFRLKNTPWPVLNIFAFIKDNLIFLSRFFMGYGLLIVIYDSFCWKVQLLS